MTVLIITVNRVMRPNQVTRRRGWRRRVSSLRTAAIITPPSRRLAARPFASSPSTRPVISRKISSRLSWATTSRLSVTPAAAAARLRSAARSAAAATRSTSSTPVTAQPSATRAASRWSMSAACSAAMSMCSRVRFIISAMGPEKISSPKRMTTRWSQTASISESWCEETMTVRPSRPRSRSSSRISTIPAGSSPFVGSSRISSSGSDRRAAAIPRRCFIPSEKRFTGSRSRPTRPTCAARRRRAPAGAAGGEPGTRGWLAPTVPG